MRFFFNKNDLETIMIKILYESDYKWFSKSDLYEETKKYYINNPDELFNGHFLFAWEKLIINNNFIICKHIRNKIQNQNEILIKISTSDNSDLSSNCDKNPITNSTELNVCEIKLIDHMLKNKQIWFGSQLLNKFICNVYKQKYYSIYELFFYNKAIGKNKIREFVKTYYLYFKRDKITEFVLSLDIPKVSNSNTQNESWVLIKSWAWSWSCFWYKIFYLKNPICWIRNFKFFN